jgi:hypothetical protein
VAKRQGLKSTAPLLLSLTNQPDFLESAELLSLLREWQNRVDRYQPTSSVPLDRYLIATEAATFQTLAASFSPSVLQKVEIITKILDRGWQSHNQGENRRQYPERSPAFCALLDYHKFPQQLQDKLRKRRIRQHLQQAISTVMAL